MVYAEDFTSMSVKEMLKDACMTLYNTGWAMVNPLYFPDCFEILLSKN